MIILGLTGSIGMGKTTIGSMLKNMGIPVHESDAAVHEFLSLGHPISYKVAAALPYYEYPRLYDKKTKAILRKELGALVFSDDEKRELLESILHPHVQESQRDFVRMSAAKGHKMVCLDIPLLFETGAEKRVDYTLVVSAPDFIQRQRVLSRPDMTEEKFRDILARQMPDAEKRKSTDYLILTGLGRAHSLKALKIALKDIEDKEFPKQNKKEKAKQA